MDTFQFIYIGTPTGREMRTLSFGYVLYVEYVDWTRDNVHR